jgi:hypothetical protein
MVAVGLPCGLRVGDQVSDTREGLPETISEGACSFWERGWHDTVRRLTVFHRSLLLHVVWWRWSHAHKTLQSIGDAGGIDREGSLQDLVVS